MHLAGWRVGNRCARISRGVSSAAAYCLPVCCCSPTPARSLGRPIKKPRPILPWNVTPMQRALRWRRRWGRPGQSRFSLLSKGALPMSETDSTKTPRPLKNGVQRAALVFAGASLLLLLIVAGLPATGWIVRTQLVSQYTTPLGTDAMLHDMEVEPPPQVDTNAIAQAQEKTAQRFPDDYPVQLAFTLLPTAYNSLGDQSREVQRAFLVRLRLLGRRFPQHAATSMACVVNYSNQKLVRMNRDSEVTLY